MTQQLVFNKSNELICEVIHSHFKQTTRIGS